MRSNEEEEDDDEEEVKLTSVSSAISMPWVLAPTIQ
jgi:hypothetical protein